MLVLVPLERTKATRLDFEVAYLEGGLFALGADQNRTSYAAMVCGRFLVGGDGDPIPMMAR